MITLILKDKVLNYLIQNGPEISLENEEYETLFEVDSDYIDMILEQMNNLGLIKLRGFIGGAFVFLTANAYDFQRRGGYTGQEELIENNLKKLLLEIESLKPSLPNKVETITSIISGLSAALGLFIK
jgi:hypothetical protein